MSQDTSSQGLLAPAEISLPNTPTPQHATLPVSPGTLDTIESSQAAQLEKARFISPTPPSSSDMTPPPSAQPRNSPSIPRQVPEMTLLPASPPATVKSTALTVFAKTKEPPKPEDIVNATESELRQLVGDMGKALQEARMSTAHFKLQHSLLAIESAEAVKRAEIEHEMTRREVEVLQSVQPRNRVSATPRPAQGTPSQVEGLIRDCKELEAINAELNRRLRKAKKFIMQEQDRNDLLMEDNARLRRRIQENREHQNRLRGQGLLNPTSRNEFVTPQRKPPPRFPDRQRTSGQSQNSFAALLAAGEALREEPVSLPSTPTVRRQPKLYPGHSRGSQSMSSLPTTPSRPATADANFFTPVNKLKADNRTSFSAPVSQVVAEDRRRHDRDSTISVSDDEVVTDEDVPASQASSLATSMLRRNPGSQEEPSIPTNPSKSSAALQSKLFGQVKKMGSFKSSGKRHASFGEADVSLKKVRLSEGVGLGIGRWDSPRGLKG